jgi:hypothetical protein
MLGNLIGGFIAILVGTTLIPTVANQVLAAQYVNGNTSLPTNITGAAFTLIGLVDLFFALAIAAIGIAVAVDGLRAAGLLGI